MPRTKTAGPGNRSRPQGGRRSPSAPGTGWLRRKAKIYAPLALVAWLAASHFLVRPLLRDQISDRFAGEARVRFAVLWPWLDATAFGVAIEGEHLRLRASRVGVDLRVLGIFGARPVAGIDVASLRAEVDEGRPVRLFRERAGTGQSAAEADLDPVRLPPLRFSSPEVVLRGEDGSARTVFAASRLDVAQAGERSYHLDVEPGELARVPFERLTARLVPRAGRLLVHDLKLRAFNGMVGGFVDVDTDRAGAFNGELEAHFVEAGAVWETYGLPYAEKRRGDLSGRVVFRGDRLALDALAGSGELRMKRGAFFSPLSFKVFLALKVPVAAEARLTSGEMGFSFENALFYVERARFHARDFELEGRGILSFDGGVDLEVGHAGTTVAVSGRLDDPTIRVLPLNGLTMPFDRIFRERVEGAR